MVGGEEEQEEEQEQEQEEQGVVVSVEGVGEVGEVARPVEEVLQL